MMDISQPPRNSSPSTSPGRDECRADLALRLARREGRTVLVERRERGPLAVQKALYQESPEICQVVIIHPPGGIAGGDKVSIGIEVEKNGYALVTTSAATKWYKAAGRSSRQEIIIRLGENSALDWLPQENLFFNAVRVNRFSNSKLPLPHRRSGGTWRCLADKRSVKNGTKDPSIRRRKSSGRIAHRSGLNRLL